MHPSAPRYEFGRYELDPSRRRLQFDGADVPLTPKAFDVLRVLLESGGEPLSKEEILLAVWRDTVVDENNLTFQISILRKTLRERGEGTDCIATIPGRGYQFVSPVAIVGMSSEIILEETERTTVEIEETRRWAVPVVATAAIIVLLVAGAVIWRSKDREHPTMSSSRVIAVLPFTPIVSDERDEALELGMADALINRISSIDGVTVRPLMAVRRYAGAEQDSIEAGRQLDVDAVLEGRIHRSGDQLRVTARLLRVSDGKQLWEASFDDRFSGIFVVQDSISRRIAGALALSLSPEAERRMRSGVSDNMEAYRAYAMGRFYFTRVLAGDMARAIESYQQAIELDPQFADAWAGLAEAYASLSISTDVSPEDSFPQAKAAAETALRIDPDSSGGHTALATVALWYDWDWAKSESEFLRALELDRGNALTRLRYAHLLSNIGRHEESRANALEAQRLDPLSPLVSTLSGQFLLQAGDVGSGTRLLRTTLEDHPDFWLAQLNLGKAYELQGRYEEALAAFRKSAELSGSNEEALMMIGYVQGELGRTAEAEAIVNQMISDSRTRYVRPTRMALVYVGMGDHDKAFLWLEKACRDRDLGLVFLYANSRWRKLENDPRFDSIRQCVNLPSNDFWAP